MSGVSERRREEFRARVAYWAERLRVSPRHVRIVSMNSKWGSCSAKGVLTFSSDLMGASAGHRDFVIVHELLHLRVRNHGKLFKSYLNAYVPGWRRWQRIE